MIYEARIILCSALSSLVKPLKRLVKSIKNVKIRGTVHTPFFTKITNNIITKAELIKFRCVPSIMTQVDKTGTDSLG